MAENSDYENEKKDQEIQQGFALLSYLIIWPLSFFILFKFPDFSNAIPWWFSAIFLLIFPYFVGSQIKKWVLNNQAKPKE
jgi:hypothetical protein